MWGGDRRGPPLAITGPGGDWINPPIEETGCTNGINDNRDGLIDYDDYALGAKGGRRYDRSSRRPAPITSLGRAIAPCPLFTRHDLGRSVLGVAQPADLIRSAGGEQGNRFGVGRRQVVAG